MQSKYFLKKITLLLFLLIIQLFGRWGLMAQPLSASSEIGFFYSLSMGKLTQNTTSTISFDVQKVDGVGFSYVHPISSFVQFESGLEYSLFRIEQRDIEIPKNDTIYNTLSLVQIPLLLRLKFLDMLYLNTGLLLDLDMHSHSIVTSRSGLGAMIGLGVAYKFDSGISLFANPYLKTHTILGSDMSFRENHLIEAGVRLGISYDF